MHPLSLKFPLSEGVSSYQYPLFQSGLLTSTLALLSSPAYIALRVASFICTRYRLLYHTPISRSVSSYLWFLKFHSTFHSGLQSEIHTSPPLKQMPDLRPCPHSPNLPDFLALCKKRLSVAYPCLCSAFCLICDLGGRLSSHSRRLFWTWSWFNTGLLLVF